MARGKGRVAKPPGTALLRALKLLGPASIRVLAARLDVTYEAVRQQMTGLVRAGWVMESRAAAAAGARPGPASRQYRLSAAAEQLFPKHYDELCVELVAHVLERFGGAGVAGILARMTDARVARWAPQLEGLTLKEKLAALSSLYEDNDAYMQVEWRKSSPALIERNCPFFNVAQKHPAICSVTVNTLERLLGFRVVREQRFQAGHGRCLFRVRLDEPRTGESSFTLER